MAVKEKHHTSQNASILLPLVYRENCKKKKRENIITVSSTNTHQLRHSSTHARQAVEAALRPCTRTEQVRDPEEQEPEPLLTVPSGSAHTTISFPRASPEQP